MKSFIDSGNIEIKPVTIFVGKNSCGKSSLLRFPAVLGQTFLARTESPLAFFGQFVDYGSFESVEYRGHKGENRLNEIKFEVGYSIYSDEFLKDYLSRWIDEETSEKMGGYLGDVFDIRIEVSLDKMKKQIGTKSVRVYYNNDLFASFSRKQDSDNIYEYCIYKNLEENGWKEIKNRIELEIKDFMYFIPLFEFDDASCIFEEMLLNERPDESESDIEKAIDIFNNQVAVASEFVRIVVDSILTDAQCMSYIGPFREGPKRIYRDTENEFRDVGAKGENLSTILLRASEKDNGMISQISSWLKRNYGYTLEISPSFSGYFNILLVDDNGIESNIMDVGYGISQVLPIVTQLIRATYVENRTYVDNHDEIIMIEQPELHLHPAAQANLAELIAFSIKAKENQCILIETHSEHLIRKLQVLVARKKILTPDMLAVYSVERDDTGKAVVNRMELDNTGRFITKWPSGFFDKSHELAAELREANRSEV